MTYVVMPQVHIVLYQIGLLNFIIHLLFVLELLGSLEQLFQYYKNCFAQAWLYVCLQKKTLKIPWH